MTRTVNGARLFGSRDKEVLRKMLWQVAEFSGVEVLTYALMSNHFHVLVRVPVESGEIADAELVRRYRVLYPKPTRYQVISPKRLETSLQAGGEEAEALRRSLLARMGDVSVFMKTLKQRFSVWFNRTHGRFGTLWAERFKSVLVEGRGNPLQTMAAYIDLNPVRAGLVADPKDYRYCGYGEAVAEGAGVVRRARDGLRQVWADHDDDPLRAHRGLMFAKGASDASISRDAAVRVLEREGAVLPKATVLRCRVRYFTEGGILGSARFVAEFVDEWQRERGRKYPPRPNAMRGADWGDLSVLRGLRQGVFE